MVLEIPAAEEGDDARAQRGAGGRSPGLRRGRRAKKKPAFTLASLQSTPGKYMLDLVGDEEFDNWIVEQMKTYLESRYQHWKKQQVIRNSKNPGNLPAPTHLKPDFNHIPAHKQIEFRLRKRQNNK